MYGFKIHRKDSPRTETNSPKEGCPFNQDSIQRKSVRCATVDDGRVAQAVSLQYKTSVHTEQGANLTDFFFLSIEISKVQSTL
jgi:hypothetical protein